MSFYLLNNLMKNASIKDIFFNKQLTRTSFRNHKNVIDKLTNLESNQNDLLNNQGDIQYSEFLKFFT